MTNKPAPCNFGSRLTNTAGSAVPLALMFSLVDIHPPLPRQRRIAADCSSFSSCSALLFRCFDLQVYDGENTSSRLLGNFTRDDMLGHVINSTSNRLWLEFNSNASGTNQGFRLTYTSEFVGPITLDQLIQVSFAIMLGFLTMIYSSVRKKAEASLLLLSLAHKKKAIERLIMKVLVMRCFKRRAGVYASGLEVPSWIHLLSVVFTNFQDYSSSSSTLDICL